MSIPNVENDVMTVSEEKCNTHTHLVFPFAIPSSAPQQTAGLWGVLTRSVCVRVHASQCVFILAFDSPVTLNQVVL